MGHEYSIEELVEFLRQNDAEKQQLALGYWDRTVNSLDKPCCFKLCNKIMTDFKPTNVSRYNYASKLAERSLQLLGEFANLTPDEKYEYLEFKRIVASCYRWSSQYHEAKNILEWIIAKTNSSEDLIDKHKKDLNPKVYNILGGVLKALGDYAGAINNYEKSLECNKHKYTPQRNIAEIHQILHEFKEAINIIKEARNSAIDKFIQPVENNYDNLTFRNVCSGYNLNNQNKLSFYDIFRTMGLIHRKYGVDLSKNKKKREAKLQFNKAKAIFNDIHKILT